MKNSLKNCFPWFLFSLVLLSLLSLGACGAKQVPSGESVQPVSDHFDGQRYFNPGSLSKGGEGPQTGCPGLDLAVAGRQRLAGMAGNHRRAARFPPRGRPAERDPADWRRWATLYADSMDGLDCPTEPVLSRRFNPVTLADTSAAQPGHWFRRPAFHRCRADFPQSLRSSGSLNPGMARENGTPRSLVPLGNRDLVREAGIPTVDT